MTLVPHVPVTETPTPEGRRDWVRKIATSLNLLIGGTGDESGSIGVLPVVDGSIPPVFIQNPDGSLIYTEV